MSSTPLLNESLDRYFAGYGDTLRLLEEFRQSRTHPQEFVLLACARLDALSNVAIAGESQRKNFSSFLMAYSGLGKQVPRVSVPDLYYYFQHYCWIVQANVPLPGRVLLFREKDRDFAQLIYDSGIAVTDTHVKDLLSSILRKLKHKYRVFPRQNVRKSCTATPDELVKLIAEIVPNTFNTESNRIENSIRNIISNYSIGTLLYRRYRSGVIHEGAVDLDSRKFFTGADLYWGTEGVHTHRFLKIQFPAKFLLELLQHSLSTYKQELSRTRKLPFGIWIGAGLDEAFLDTRSIFAETVARLTVR